MIKTEDPEERTASSDGNEKHKANRRGISNRALEVVSEGARTYPDCETTVAVSESDWETTAYRIFRGRHMSGDPLHAADQWIRWVKKHCTSMNGELKTTAVWTDADGGSVLVAITWPGIAAKKKTSTEQPT